jgi:hypothetical protein
LRAAGTPFGCLSAEPGGQRERDQDSMHLSPETSVPAQLVTAGSRLRYMVKSGYMNRPLCWACTLIGTLSAFAVFGLWTAAAPRVEVAQAAHTDIPAIEAVHAG